MSLLDIGKTKRDVSGKSRYTIRIEFMRGEEVKFISHLDIMRTFERAVRRAGIPVAYSQGFNPQPVIVFGLPLSVGVTSLAEYADIELTEFMEPLELKNTLNNELPSGLKIFNAGVRYNDKNIMASIYMASYDVFVYITDNMAINYIKREVKEFLSSDTLIAVKEGKKGKKEINIKPMIFEFTFKNVNLSGCHIIKENTESTECTEYTEFTESKECKESTESKEHTDNNISEKGNEKKEIFRISTMLRAGGEANLKPELLIETFNRQMNTNLNIIHIHRTGLFVNVNGKLLKPMDPEILKK